MNNVFDVVDTVPDVQMKLSKNEIFYECFLYFDTFLYSYVVNFKIFQKNKIYPIDIYEFLQNKTSIPTHDNELCVLLVCVTKELDYLDWVTKGFNNIQYINYVTYNKDRNNSPRWEAWVE